MKSLETQYDRRHAGYGRYIEESGPGDARPPPPPELRSLRYFTTTIEEFATPTPGHGA